MILEGFSNLYKSIMLSCKCPTLQYICGIVVLNQFCDEKYHTPNSLRSCECGLGGSKFLLKYHPSLPDPGGHNSSPAEPGRGSTEHNFVGKYPHISRKSVREAGDTPNLSWFRVDSLTVVLDKGLEWQNKGLPADKG